MNSSGLPVISTAGILVRNRDGRVGITTEHIKKAGSNKDRIPVMWQGMGYTISEWPEDLEEITLDNAVTN